MEIYLDQDGVLCKFIDGACKLHGKELKPDAVWNFYELWGMTSKDFWHKIDLEPYFWSNLEPFDHLTELVSLVKSYDPNFMILTSPHNSDYCYAGKRRWISKNLRLNPSKRAILTSTKERVSGPGKVLIDDHVENIEEWEKRGGKGILFPSPVNNLKHIAEPDSVNRVKTQLEDYRRSM